MATSVIFKNLFLNSEKRSIRAMRRVIYTGTYGVIPIPLRIPRITDPIFVVKELMKSLAVVFSRSVVRDVFLYFWIIDTWRPGATVP